MGDNNNNNNNNINNIGLRGGENDNASNTVSSSGTNGSGNDLKLKNLVQRLITMLPSSTSPNADYIAHCIRTQHMEYQHTNLKQFKKKIKKAIKEITEDGGNTANSNVNSSSNGGGGDGSKKHQQQQQQQQQGASKQQQEQLSRRKRKYGDKTDSDNNKVDNNSTSNSHPDTRVHDYHSINGMLSQGYQRLQQEREAAVAAAVAYAAAAAAIAADNEKPPRASGGGTSSASGPSSQQQQSRRSAATSNMHDIDTDSTPIAKIRTSTQPEKMDISVDCGEKNSSKNSSTPNNKKSYGDHKDKGNDANNKERSKDNKEKDIYMESMDIDKDKDKNNNMIRTAKNKKKRLSVVKQLQQQQQQRYSENGSGNGGNGWNPSPTPWERYNDLGGIDSIIQQIREYVEYPLLRPEIYEHLGVDPPRGILLRGPPGCGKTHLANAIAGQLNDMVEENQTVSYFRVSAPELVSGLSGESEGRIRDLFLSASDYAPSIIFMDEIDAIAPKRVNDGSGGRGMEKRMVAQLLTCMDMLNPKYTKNNKPVIVLAATNQPDALDPALRRAGRFDKEITLGIPDEDDREKILRTKTLGIRLQQHNSANDDVFNFRILARKTPGYVGADILSLIKEAGLLAIKRVISEVENSSEQQQKKKGEDEKQKEQGSNNHGQVDEKKKQQNEDKGSSMIVEKPSSTEKKEKSADAIDNDEEEDDDDDEEEKNERNSTNGKNSEGVTMTKTSPAPTSEKLKSLLITQLPKISPEVLDKLYVTMDDFLTAIPLVQPSCKREGFAMIPDVSWDDIGALNPIREELTLSVLEPIRNPEKFNMLGIPLPTGILLYGPPGCGKTLLAKAIANESGANFISVKGPELLDKYVGESERSVRRVFDRARISSPCIIFFDELDSLCPKRGGGGNSDSGSGVSERVVNQLLTEMDGLDTRRSVFIIAATNRPELIDPAMLRPGRLDKLLYVPLPTPEDRVAILKAASNKMNLSNDVDLNIVGKSKHANGYSGADCTALLREAGLEALKENMIVASPTPRRTDDNKKNGKADEKINVLSICKRHFDRAFSNVLPSVCYKDQLHYNRIRKRIAGARTRGRVALTEEEEHEEEVQEEEIKGEGKNEAKQENERGNIICKQESKEKDQERKQTQEKGKVSNNDKDVEMKDAVVEKTVDNKKNDENDKSAAGAVAAVVVAATADNKNNNASVTKEKGKDGETNDKASVDASINKSSSK